MPVRRCSPRYDARLIVSTATAMVRGGDGAYQVRIAMIGHKRYGSREGGVEVAVTELARRMAALGHDVTCYDRRGSDVMTGDVAATCERVVDGVRVVPVKTIDRKVFAALSSSYFATKQAIKDRPDVVHYHAEGPCAPLPLVKRAGIRTVATIHGLDWQRAKWGKLASTYIKMGERLAATKADGLIVLSRSAQDYFKKTYGRETTFIPNGVESRQLKPANEIKKRWGSRRTPTFCIWDAWFPRSALSCSSRRIARWKRTSGWSSPAAAPTPYRTRRDSGGSRAATAASSSPVSWTVSR